FDRLIRAKKPWAVAAASAVFLGAGILAGGYAVNYRAVSADTIKKAMEQGDAAIKKVQSINGTAAAKEADVKKLTDQVKGVIAGKDEQKDWILLNEYINKCLPNPEPLEGVPAEVRGGNLRSRGKTLADPSKPIDQTIYWNSKPVLDAMREYRDRVRGGQSADQPLPDEIRKLLPL